MSKNFNNKKVVLFNEKKIREIWTIFNVKKLTLKVKILQFMMMFTQDPIFLPQWLLVLSLKDGSIECAKVCNKSVVILKEAGNGFRKNKLEQKWQQLAWLVPQQPPASKLFRSSSFIEAATLAKALCLHSRTSYDY